MPSPSTDRRRFVRDLTLGGLVLGSAGLSACGGGGGDSAAVATSPAPAPSPAPTPAPSPAPAEPTVAYDHGVASGDPLADRVILWTRVTPGDSATTTVSVTWELSTTATFTTLVASGTTPTDAGRDWTVKVDATGLQPATRHWYRFRVGTQTSPVGRTRTLPTGAVAQARLAVFSCAHHEAGYFNVYAAAAQRDDLDAAVHLGDYLYEYGRNASPSTVTPVAGREVEPAGELLTLADYRRRHAQAKRDTDLQALHTSVPVIAVWDDHEFANNAWRDGAASHSEGTEGTWTARRAAAAQAWHEWMPVRSSSGGSGSGGDALAIWRSFAFGDLLALHLLDTRIAGRDRPIALADHLGAAGLDTATLATALGDASRQLLGATQAAWLQGQLAASSATWQVLGQQVRFGRMEIPAPVVQDLLVPGSGVGVTAYGTLAMKARLAPASLTAAERAVLAQPSVPYNLDAWDGYPVAREAVLDMARTQDRNLVVLAGDSHNAWASDLQDRAGRTVGVEFATASVTSPGLEALLPTQDPATLASGLTGLVPTLRYADTSRRGYLVVTATPAECRADWVFVSGVASRSGWTAATGRSLRVLPGAAGRRVVEV